MTQATLTGINFRFPEEVEAVRQAVRELCDKHIRPKVAAMETQEQILPEVLDALKETGVFAVPFPERYRGLGLGMVGFCVVQEEIAKAHASTCLLVAASTMLVGMSLLAFGTEDQKDRYLVPLAGGDLIGSFCLTEPGAGSDIAGIETRAVRDGKGWRLKGTKVFVTNGDVAGLFLVFAKTDPKAGREGMSAFLVERGFKGVTFLRLEKKMGLKASGTAQFVFDDVFVPEENLLGGAEGKGFYQALTALNYSRLALAASCLGTAKEAFELGWNFASERKAFGQRIRDFQTIQHYLADMWMDIFTMESLVYRVAWMADAGMDFAMEASIAKAFCTEAAERVIDKALQIHGGYGYIADYAIERLYRDHRVTRIFEGTNEIQRNNIYRSLERRRG